MFGEPTHLEIDQDLCRLDQEHELVTQLSKAILQELGPRPHIFASKGLGSVIQNRGTHEDDLNGSIILTQGRVAFYTVDPELDGFSFKLSTSPA